jgi:uncharacterized protein YxjI
LNYKIGSKNLIKIYDLLLKIGDNINSFNYRLSWHTKVFFAEDSLVNENYEVQISLEGVIFYVRKGLQIPALIGENLYRLRQMIKILIYSF